MINVMEWLDVLVTVGAIIATATAVVIGTRVQQRADRESTHREIVHIRNGLLECQKRIDNILLARNGHQSDKH